MDNYYFDKKLYEYQAFLEKNKTFFLENPLMFRGFIDAWNDIIISARYEKQMREYK